MAPVELQVRRLAGRAIQRYGLIQDGDRIAVAVSGGKDSLGLLCLLRDIQRRAPVQFHLTAIHVDPGFQPSAIPTLETFFHEEGFAFHILRTDYGPRAHRPGNAQNPCFLCARLRRGALFRKARELGCAKVALGHNQDDFIETFLINIFYSGQVAAMLPRQPFFEGTLEVIRPLALVPASQVEAFSRERGLPIVPNPCPSAERSRRTRLRSLLEGLYKENPKVRGNIFHAMSNVNLDHLPKEGTEEEKVRR